MAKLSIRDGDQFFAVALCNSAKMMKKSIGATTTNTLNATLTPLGGEY